MNHKFHIVCLMALITTLSHPTRGDEAAETKTVSDTEIKQYVDQLGRDGRFITDLIVRQANRRMEFEITSAVNTGNRSWIVLVNLSDAAFEENSEKYLADGYKMPVHRTITVNRRKLHSAVWVQDVQSAGKLVLPEGEIPESSRMTDSRFEPLKMLMRRVLKENNLPGATLAVSRHGQLIFEGGFGYADAEQKRVMTADASMRIASLSKSFTAVAVLILVQDNALQLDASLLDCLASGTSPGFPVKKALDIDPRWSQITIRHLLQHSGGWDKSVSKDSMFRLPDITRALKLKHLARSNDIVHYQLLQPLDFDPGSKYSYSNVGYCFLGRVIEQVSGQSYADFVHERILVPAGMTQTRPGKTRLSDRASDEVHYYTQLLTKSPAVWDLAQKRSGKSFEMVAPPYGQWDLEVLDSVGGWTSTAGDLMRFMDAIERRQSPLLTEESRQLMLAPPSFADPEKNNVWYGLGWNVRQLGHADRRDFWHIGSLAGTSTLMFRRHDGFQWAVLFNIDRTPDGEQCTAKIESEIYRAVDRSQAP